MKSSVRFLIKLSVFPIQISEDGTKAKFQFCSKKMFGYGCIFAVFWVLQSMLNFVVGPMEVLAWFIKYVKNSNTIDNFTMIGRKKLEIMKILLTSSALKQELYHQPRAVYAVVY